MSHSLAPPLDHMEYSALRWRDDPHNSIIASHFRPNDLPAPPGKYTGIQVPSTKSERTRLFMYDFNQDLNFTAESKIRNSHHHNKGAQ
jgi:hypothetical protein